MSCKELNITVEMPAIGNAYGISCHVTGFEPTFGDEENTATFQLQFIKWRTYCDKLNDDVYHTMYDQWMCGKDLVDMLEQVRKLIETLSQ